MSEKKKSIISEYIQIFKYIKPRRPAYFTALIFDCLTEICFFLLPPLVMKIMIDAAVASNFQLLSQGVILTVAISFVGMVLFVTSEFFFFNLVNKTTAGIRMYLFKHILHLPVSYVEQNHSGDTISRLTNDVEAMEKSYGWPLRMILISLGGGISSAITMIILDWKVGIFLIGIGFLSVIANNKERDTIKKLSDEIQKFTGKYTEGLSNIINGFFTMKSFQMEKSIFEDVDGVNRQTLKNTIELKKKSAIIESRNFFFGAITYVGVIIAAAYLSIRGISQLGSVVSMILLLGHVTRVFGFINSMYIRLRGHMAGAARVSELMETTEESERVDIEAGSNQDAIIELEDIKFSYDGKNSVLNGVDIMIKKGEVAALVGPSGCGKSTIIKIILGYYPPASGGMTINGRALKSYTMNELRSMIAYVPQDAYIFDGTIEDNIRYGRLEATKEEIINAAKSAYADEFIQEMENKYETMVGERGIKLSGGQRQRIAIARAFLKNAPILLLDEATSALDSQSEQYVQEALNKLMKNKTSLIIAHRLSTIEHADIIYVIDSGRTIEQGKHADLIEKGSLYHRLYKIQFGLEQGQIA